MDEIREVESELRRLREEADHYKNVSSASGKEKKTLEARNEYLLNKLKEASYVYGEAGKRLLYFINNQVNPVTKRLNDLDVKSKNLSSQDKILGDSLISVEKTLRDDFTKVDKRLNALNENVSATEEKIHRAIKASMRKSDKDDAEISKNLAAAVMDFDVSMRTLKAALDRKISTMLNLFDKKTDSKMDTLREHSLLMGKDIEALKKFEGDIEGLEGKLQTTVSNLTQTRLDMEKLAQSVKSEMNGAKAAVDDELGKMTNDVNTKLLEFSSELRQADEKNLGTIRLELKKNQAALDKQLQLMSADMTSFENSAGAKIRSGQAAIRKEFSAFGDGVEKRLRMLEANIGANSKNQKDIEKMLSGRIDVMVKHGVVTDEKIDSVEAGLIERLENFIDITKRKELMIKNEMGKIGKSVDQKVGHASLELERKVGLMGKDVENLKSIESGISGLAAEVGKRKEETASLNAKINIISQDITDKSEKNDMIIKKQLDSMQSEVKNNLESAEARIVKENVSSFSKVRHNLKEDIHTLREENATLKAEVRNLQKLGSIVNDLQQAVAAAQGKVDDTVNNVEQISAGVSADIDKQALKVSKDMAGISASLKADLKDIISKEKERFAGQSAELDAKYDSLSKKAIQFEGRTSGNYQTGSANAKALSALSRKVDRLMKEIVGLKKEYKVEMGRLLKELEG